MKKIFLLRPLHELSFTQHIIHGIVTLGVPLALIKYFFDLSFLPWPERLLGAVGMGIVGGLVTGLLERAVVVVIKKKRTHSNKDAGKLN